MNPLPFSTLVTTCHWNVATGVLYMQGWAVSHSSCLSCGRDHVQLSCDTVVGPPCPQRNVRETTTAPCAVKGRLRALKAGARGAGGRGSAWTGGRTAMGGLTSKVGFGARVAMRDEEEEEPRRRNSLAFFVADYCVGEYVGNFDKLRSRARAVIREQKAKPVKTTDPRAEKLLFIATNVSQGNLRVLREQVISNFATINRKYKQGFEGDTLLHICCREGYAVMVNFMLDPRNRSMFDTGVMEINPKDAKGRIPLWVCFTPPQATYLGQTFGVGDDGIPLSERPEAVENDADWVRPGTDDDRQELVRMLVDNGADVHAVDYHGFTSLHYACMWGWLPSVKLLLGKGVKTDRVNKFGRTPMVLAVEFGHLDVVTHFLEEAGCDIDERDSSGNTPILTAVVKGNYDMCELLLSHDADPNMANFNKRTPLKTACKQQMMRIVNLLLDFGAQRSAEAFEMLEGDALEELTARLAKEDEEREQEAARLRAEEEKRSLRKSKPKGYRDASPYGQWVAYEDKRGRGIFYYNKVTRKSQLERPLDYFGDPRKAGTLKQATFGMSYYH